MIRRYTKISSELALLIEKFLEQESLHELLIILRNCIRAQDSSDLILGEYAAVMEQLTEIVNQKRRERIERDSIQR